MKAASHKSESKKRKRDDSQEPISESPKKAKVHAQRKFAQGAAFNSPVITPIKDKVRPPPSVPNPAPMLTSKRPNTEDFLTFLCFRRTSILPPKLDFFKDALRSEPHPSPPSNKANSSTANHKINVEQPVKQHNKKSDKNDESKKSHTPAVQALRKKYQEQRLAKQKVTNVTKLAQKVKGKNMVRTRSSTIVEEVKVAVKKSIPDKENKTKPSGLRSGLKRVQPIPKKLHKKVIKPKHLRAGLRSSGPTKKTPEKAATASKPITATVKKAEKEVKKPKVPEVPDVKKNVKLRKTEGFSDFSSDDNEPLLAVKKPKMEPKKGMKGSVEEKKTFVKTRSQANDLELSQGSLRPTRKTKEAAAIYMEMLTKKLVSPEKSGDEDVSSVESFPELPNAKRSEQRETELRARALAGKKTESKSTSEDKVKEMKKNVSRKSEQTLKTESKPSEEEQPKKSGLAGKKENKNTTKQEEITKKGSKASTKEDTPKAKQKDEEKKEEVQIPRPATRSRHIEEVEVELKKPTVKVLPKKLKGTSNKEVEKPKEEKITLIGKKGKGNKEKATQKEKLEEEEKKVDSKESENNSSKVTETNKQAVKNDSTKMTKKTVEKGKQKPNEKEEVKEKSETEKVATQKKGKKSTEGKSSEKETEVKKATKLEKKAGKNAAESTEGEDVGTKRPTRKCSTADKIWIDIDGFTSDEDDFLDVTPIAKTRASTEKAVILSEKQKAKTEPEKKSNKSEVSGKAKTEKKEIDKEKESKTVLKKETKIIVKKEMKAAEKKETKEVEKKEIKGVEKKEVKSQDKKDGKEVDKKELKILDKKESKPTDKKEIKVVDKQESKLTDKKETKAAEKKEVKAVEKKDLKVIEKTELKEEKKETKVLEKKELKSVEKKELKSTDKTELKEDKKETKVAEKKKEIKIDKKIEPKKPKIENKVKIEEESSKTSTKPVKADTEKKGKVELKKSEDVKKDESVSENQEVSQALQKGTKGIQVEKKVKESAEVKSLEITEQKEVLEKQLEQDPTNSAVKEIKKSVNAKEAAEPVTKKPAAKVEEKKDKPEKLDEESKKGKTEKVEVANFETGKKAQKKVLKPNKRKSNSPRSLREREAMNKEAKNVENNSKSYKRTRPVRSCSTGEKKWIETDSDSFSFYETSDDEDNLPIVDFSSKNKVKSSPVRAEAKESEVSTEVEKEVKAVKTGNEEKSAKKVEDHCSDNFSESDEEPLQKKAHMAEGVAGSKPEGKAVGKVEQFEVKSPGRVQREMPALNPLKKISGEVFPVRATDIINIPPVYKPPKPDTLPAASVNIIIPNEPKTVFYETKNFEGKSEVSGVRQVKDAEISDLRGTFMAEQRPNPVVSVPNRIEMILNTLKRDKISDTNSYSNDVKVTFGKIPYQPIPHTSQINQYPYTVSFPPPQREPISTHGLDLLSEVALPTTPKEKINSQTERIEKWLKDSLAAEHKKNFPPYEDLEYKSGDRQRSSQSLIDKPLSEGGYYYGKPTPAPITTPVPSPVPASAPSTIPVAVKVSSHTEVPKFGQVELIESQKLLKRNVFSPEVKQQDTIRTEQQQQQQQPVQPKKTLTSVQDLLKLQKERKEVVKSSTDNSPHLKNCKCNNCVVKKGWFKNKPVPKSDSQKSPPVDDVSESAKPFQSLTKAFNKMSGDTKNSKMSVSVAPMVSTQQTTTVTPPRNLPIPSSSRDVGEKKGLFPQRKLSFLERMKERERKEAAAALKPNPNAFSPNNESSVYAFEPEPEQPMSVNAPFRSKTRESRTSSTNTSKSDEDVLKICEDESSTTVSSGTQVEKTTSETKVSSKASQSASIAVQVNLDSETVAEVEAVPELQDGKSIEISTQTEVPEEDSDSPMFYIPLQQARATGATGSSEQQLIQGVALKLGTEGPMGPNQRVIMKAKLVTKPPDTPSIKAVVMPQPKRIFDQKNNNPPIGTVQPTTRKPPEVLSEEPDADKSTDSNPLPSVVSSNKSDTSAEPVSQASVDSGIGSESLGSKSRNSPAGFSGKATAKTKTPQSSSKEKSETSDEHSPCSSASSSYKSKRTSKQKNSESVINPSNSTWLPPARTPSKLVEAPTFHPTEKEFQDPFEFFERIRPAAEKFGLCRIVPPSNFKPDCKVSDDMRFTAYNQYVHRMFHRWGPNIKEMMAIKKYLATQSISLKQPPWIGGIEVDLPRLYQSVQNCGGLMKVMEKKKWHQVADMMKIPKAAQDRVTKLDDIYCKYLLPYDTLSHDERQKLFDEVEKDWLDRQKTPIESQESQGEEEAEEENYIEECEECVVKGKNMALNQFYRIARNSMTMWFKNPEPQPREVENEFWKHVSERNHHVCVHSGSIDSSGWGYGFPIAKNNSFSKHPWNLKVLTNNSGSVLRSLGPVMGVTVPTIHVGMVFTAFCWYRDPHGLPWIEYLHTGAPKIWYGISDDNSTVFQEALTKLLPRYIKNKTIWLPSDTAMIPPGLLVEHGVSLCHTVQEPGQFILVFPRAFTSSICTGYLVSESVYFAQPSWLTTAEQVFKDIQESSEPTMFSLEKLLFSIATDSRSSVEVLKQVLPMVWHIRQKEVDERKTLFNLGLKTSERLPPREAGSKKRRGRWAQEDDGDYECEVCRMNLYVSLVTNSQEEGVYCLPHAIELLTQKRHQLKFCKLMYNYTQDEMNELVEKLEQRIESKSQKKLQSKSSTSAK